VKKYYRLSSLSPEQLDDAIKEIWTDLVSDERHLEDAHRACADISSASAGTPTPFEVERLREGLGVTGTIIVAVVAQTTGTYVIRGLDALWEQVIWPRLRQRFGTAIASQGEGAGSDFNENDTTA
jgi:hypothetical protein